MSTMASPCAAPGLTPARARAMLADLLAGFSSKSFQRKLDVLISAQSGQIPQDLLHVPGRTELALSVQREVLPRYGFDGSEYGVAQMLEAIQPLLARDVRLQEQSEAIRQKLRVQLTQVEAAQEVKHLKKEEALALQTDLLQQFQRADVRLKLSKMTEDADMREQLAKDIKMGLLSTYGFPEGEQGLQMMSEALAEWQWDSEMRSLSKAIEEGVQKGNFLRQDTASTVDTESGAGSENESHSKEELLQLLRELSAGFGAPGFQWKLSLLKGRNEDPLDGIEELAFRVQKKLLPKFGFQGSRRGVAEMVNECNRYSTDSTILELQTDINTKLGMDIKGRGLWRARA